MYNNKNFSAGYHDGLHNIDNEAREDRIDEIAAKDGWLAASDYEDGCQDGYEDRDYDSSDSWGGGYDGDY